MKKEYIQPESTIYIISSEDYCGDVVIGGSKRTGEEEAPKGAGGDWEWEDEDDF